MRKAEAEAKYEASLGHEEMAKREDAFKSVHKHWNDMQTSRMTTEN